MTKKTTPYIYSLFCCFVFLSLHAQKPHKTTLVFTSNIPKDANFLKKEFPPKTFTSTTKLLKHKDSVLETLKEKGYFTTTIDNITQTKETQKVYLTLGVQIQQININIKSNDYNISSIKRDSITIPPNKLKSFLKNINQELINNGYTFASAKLSKIKITNSTILKAILSISPKKTRKIDAIRVKGIERYPKKYLNYFLRIDKKQSPTRNNIESISKRINTLGFASELKKPEILFSNDSTILYVYLKKKEANTFDGLINFNTENRKIKLKGHLDLTLNNALNYGEQIKFNWRNNGNNRQNLTLDTKLPYLFNTKITSTLQLNLYRQDSSFVNSSLKIGFSHPINNNVNIGATLRTETSNSLQENSIFKNYTKNIIGLSTNYKSNTKNTLTISLSIYSGSRNSEGTKTQQASLRFTSSKTFSINKRINLYIKNDTGYLDSEKYLENELFRIGGINSIRGFTDQSIATSKYSFFNSEFRLKINNQTQLYSVHDIGTHFSSNKTNNLYAIGLGYIIKKSKNIIDINYIIGNTTNQELDLKSAIISVKFLTLF